MAFEQFPFANLHDQNLDWVLKETKRLAAEFAKDHKKLTDLESWSKEFAEWVDDYFERLNVNAAVKEYLDELKATGRLSELFGFLFYKGNNKAWDVYRAGDMVMQTVRIHHEFGDHDAELSQETGEYMTDPIYRALDVPVEPGAATFGSADSFEARVTNITTANQRIRYRVVSRRDINNNNINVSLAVFGKHATPPASPQNRYNAEGQAVADIAKTYYDARVDGRKFAYGRNFTYASTNQLNDSTGAALMECDTLALMAALRIPYNASPYALDTDENATYDFANLNPGANALPWMLYDDYGGRVTNTGAQNWYFWHNAEVFNNLSEVRSGDFVIFVTNTSKYFDGIVHIGVIREEEGVPYVYHVSKWRRPSELTAPVVRRDSLEDLVNAQYYGGVYYFARPDYSANQ